MIRAGFISNSSSSSFILKYDEANKMNTSQEVLDNLDKFEEIYIVGRELSSGWDVFELTYEMKKAIKNFPDRWVKYADIQYAVGNPTERRGLTWEEYDHWKDFPTVEKDYSSIDEDTYEFIKNYLLSSEEWETVYNAEWFEEGENVRASRTTQVFIYEEDCGSLPPADLTNTTMVINTFVSEVYDFIPVVYMTAPPDIKDYIMQLRDDVKFYRGFRVLDFDKSQAPITNPFYIKRLFGIINETKDIRNFLKGCKDE